MLILWNIWIANMQDHLRVFFFINLNKFDLLHYYKVNILILRIVLNNIF